MKKIIFATILFFFINNILAAQTSDNIEKTKIFTTKTKSLEAFVNNKAERIANKDKNLKPAVTKLALKAFNNAKKNGINVKKSIITIIDYSLPSSKKRLWVADIKNEKILYSSLVAHGRNSGENYSTSFSNIAKSRQTSIGVFLTENTYHGKHGYSLRINGLEKGFNDKAKSRSIDIHSAPYVNKKTVDLAGRIGRSYGCPAIEKKLTKPIINTIKDGSLVFSYYPDKNWLEKSELIKSKAVKS